jgi:hypothetical protein
MPLFGSRFPILDCRATLSGMDHDRGQLGAIVRRSLARYRGGSFALGDSGGARGMLFFTDIEGREFFCGGLN